MCPGHLGQRTGKLWAHRPMCPTEHSLLWSAHEATLSPPVSSDSVLQEKFSSPEAVGGSLLAYRQHASMPRYLCLWTQHRLKDRELAAFCAPEINNALQSVGQPASEPYTCQRDLTEPALIPARDLRWITAQDEQQLQTIASVCTLLDSIVEASCHSHSFSIYSHQSTCLVNHIYVVYSAVKARLMQ